MKLRTYNIYEICHEILDKDGNTIDVIELAEYKTERAAFIHIEDFCSDYNRIRTIRHYQYQKDELGNEYNYHLVDVFDGFDREEE